MGQSSSLSLDLKFSYWQVEVEEDSKALNAFNLGPLGFYKCEHECLIRLTKAPATFQWLMQSCSGQFVSTVLYHIS